MAGILLLYYNRFLAINIDYTTATSPTTTTTDRNNSNEKERNNEAELHVINNNSNNSNNNNNNNNNTGNRNNTIENIVNSSNNNNNKDEEEVTTSAVSAVAVAVAAAAAATVQQSTIGTTATSKNSSFSKPELLFFRRHCSSRSSSSSSSSSSQVKEDGIHEQQQQQQEEEWWNPINDNAWMKQIPYFLLIGAKKAGTTALYSWLLYHPQIVPPKYKELLYFNPRRLEDQKKRRGVKNGNGNGNVHYPQIRDELYNKGNNFQRAKKKIINTSSNNSSSSSSNISSTEMLISFEATPGYLLYSTLSRIPILCAVPWTKLLVILRNPIDRSYSHYNFMLDQAVKAQAKAKANTKAVPQNEQKEQRYQHRTVATANNNNNNNTTPVPAPALYLIDARNKKEVTFEGMIEIDMIKLRKAGVIRPQHETTTTMTDDAFAGSVEERVAWTKYQHMVTRDPYEGVIGRSLYILQLQEWYDSFRTDLGRDPTTEILVIRNEDMTATPDQVYQQIIVEWLQLSPHPLPQQPHKLQKMVTQYRTEPLRPETKRMLQEFYEPYNQRLYQLLGWNTNTTNTNTNTSTNTKHASSSLINNKMWT